MKHEIVTLSSPRDVLLWCPGDRIEGMGPNRMVVRVDPERCQIHVAEATRWRRLYWWARGRVKDGWRWVVCTACDARDWVRGREP